MDIERRHAATREASEWMARLGGDPVADADRQAFHAWLDASPANRDAYFELVGIWAAVGDLDQVRLRAMASKPADGIFGRLAGFRPRPISVAGWRPAGAVALLAAIMAAGALLVPGPETSSFATAVGEQRKIVLGDGTSVTLNTDSQIEVRYVISRRHIELKRGEAFFDVTHSMLRPFVVDAGATELRVLGTRFNVRRTGDHGTAVTVASGRVRLSVFKPDRQDGSVASIEIGAGQKADAAMGRSIVTTQAPDATGEPAWLHGRLVFRKTSLQDVAAELQRYVVPTIEIPDPAVAGLEISGSFSTANAPDMLLTLERILPVTVVHVDANRIRISARE